MNGMLGRLGAVFMLAVLFAGAGYGGWVAWDRGLIGHNPRAPVAAAMEAAVREQAWVDNQRLRRGPRCLQIESGRPKVESKGLPGLAQIAAPGSYAITLLLQTSARDQAAREQQLERLDFLAAHGLLHAEDTTVATDHGERAARRYRLTWKGYAANSPRYGSRLCFYLGHREFAAIDKIERLPERLMGHAVYQVGYREHAVEVPDWAREPGAARLFPLVHTLTAEAGRKAVVIRGDHAWRSRFAVEMEVARAGGRPPSRASVDRRYGAQELRPPTPREVADLMGRSRPGFSRRSMSTLSFACLPVALQRGGDDKAERRKRGAEDFVVTYYDRANRSRYEFPRMVRALHVLAALELAGLARMEPVVGDEGPEEGVRYRVDPDAVNAMRLVGGGSCIPAGRMKLEVLSVQPGERQVRVVARGVIEGTPAWVERIAGSLPALRALLDHGLALSTALSPSRASGGPAPRWRMYGFAAHYPRPQYTSLPAYLVPLMPKTAAAFGDKPVHAPSELERMPSAVQTPALVNAPAAPVRGEVVVRRGATAQAPAAPAYPANGARVHMISIYEAARHGAGAPKPPAGLGVVPVTIADRGSVLLLFGYRAVEWRIKVIGGGPPKRVVAVGMRKPRVTFVNGDKVDVTVVTRAELGGFGTSGRAKHFPTDREPNTLIDAAALSRRLTGSLPKTLQAEYRAPAGGFSVSPQTSAFAMPEPLGPPPEARPVTLAGMAPEYIKGHIVERGFAGPFTEAWTKRAYSAGKVYFEARIGVSGSLSAHRYANIGLCALHHGSIDTPMTAGGLVMAPGAEALYADGDLFGVAVDFDRQRLYYRVNGKWATGKPGSGNGIPLSAGKRYRVCAFASGSSSADVARGRRRSDTTWALNFGEALFAGALPAGYAPFQGGTQAAGQVGTSAPGQSRPSAPARKPSRYVE